MKKLCIIMTVLMLFALQLFADSTNKYAGAVVDNATVGTVTWTNPNNASGTTNGVYATAANLAASQSHYLYATNYGFNIPTNATINGVVVAPTRKASATTGGGLLDFSVVLIVNGVLSSSNLATATTYTTSDVTENHGSPTQLWGFALNPSSVNSSRFGAAFSCQKINSGGALTASVDAMEIVVYYTPFGTVTRRANKRVGQFIR